MALAESGLNELYEKGLYQEDYLPPEDAENPGELQPGIDCEDYAAMFGHYAEKKFPGCQAGQASILYGQMDPDAVGGYRVRAGHVASVIFHDGVYYVVDPMSDWVRGPYGDLEKAKGGIRELAEFYKRSNKLEEDIVGIGTENGAVGECIGPYFWEKDLLKGQFEAFLLHLRPGAIPGDYYPPPDSIDGGDKGEAVGEGENGNPFSAVE